MYAFGSTFHIFIASPVRLARPRTPGFHPGDRGSNPLREAILLSLSPFSFTLFSKAVHLTNCPDSVLIFSDGADRALP